jgi:hypothetical protein
LNRVHSGRLPTLALLIPLVLAIVMGGCARHDDLVGTVTQISPQLCIGRHAALGSCFSETAGSDVLSGLQVGECVQVTVADRAITKVEPVPAANHRDDCPGS